MVAQQGSKLPYAVLALVSSQADMNTRGYSRRRVRRFQLDLYSDDLEVVLALGEAVFRALVGFEGHMGTTHVQHAFLLSERDLHEPEVTAKGAQRDGLFRRSQDWELAESG